MASQYCAGCDIADVVTKEFFKSKARRFQANKKSDLKRVIAEIMVEFKGWNQDVCSSLLLFPLLCLAISLSPSLYVLSVFATSPLHAQRLALGVLGVTGSITVRRYCC